METNARELINKAASVISSMQNLEKEYENKTKGKIYQGRLLVYHNRLIHLQKMMDKLAKPEPYFYWEFTALRRADGIIIFGSVSFPSSYDHDTVSILVSLATRADVKTLLVKRKVELGVINYEQNSEKG